MPRTRTARPLTAAGRGMLAAVLALSLSGAPADAAGGSVKAKLKKTTLIVNGTTAGEELVLRLAAADPSTLEVDVGGDGSADVGFDRSTFDRIEVDAGAGDDVVRIDAANGAFDTEGTRLGGGAGDDLLIGGPGREILDGGPGDDTADGNANADVGQLGPGADTFVWDPGDGSDVVEGGGGFDTLRFNGSNASELFELSANGSRFRFFRSVGSITMDSNGVEALDLKALGGLDRITVNDLSGTDVTSASLDLAASGGGADGELDQITLIGTAASDLVAVHDFRGAPEISGLAVGVEIDNSDLSDRLIVLGLGGNDTLSAAGKALVADVLFEGGEGNDTLRASNGGDVLDGGPGDDALSGGPGDDVLIGGPGDDVISCGGGDDVLVTDDDDTILADCR